MAYEFRNPNSNWAVLERRERDPRPVPITVRLFNAEGVESDARKIGVVVQVNHDANQPFAVGDQASDRVATTGHAIGQVLVPRGRPGGDPEVAKVPRCEPSKMVIQRPD